MTLLSRSPACRQQRPLSGHLVVGQAGHHAPRLGHDGAKRHRDVVGQRRQLRRRADGARDDVLRDARDAPTAPVHVLLICYQGGGVSSLLLLETPDGGWTSATHAECTGNGLQMNGHDALLRCHHRQQRAEVPHAHLSSAHPTMAVAFYPPT